MGIKVKRVRVCDGYTLSTNNIEFIYDSTYISPRSFELLSLDKRVKTFFIGKYSVTNEISIVQVWLNFFNDTLIEIKFDYVENGSVVDAIREKYGFPKDSLINHGNTCGSRFETKVRTWNTNNKNISCVSMQEIIDKETFSWDIILKNHSHDTEIKNRIYEKQEKRRQEHLKG